MKTEKQYFDEAISLNSYFNKIESHKESTLQIHKQFKCPEDDEFIEVLKKVKPEILVITEDWCGDAMFNNPIRGKIAKADIGEKFAALGLEHDRHPERGGGMCIIPLPRRDASGNRGSVTDQN